MTRELYCAGSVHALRGTDTTFAKAPTLLLGSKITTPDGTMVEATFVNQDRDRALIMTMDLFGKPEESAPEEMQPLARRMRPLSINEFEGQEHFLGEGKLLRRMLASGRLSSLVFYGPPGCGKTALAHIIAAKANAHVERINATASSVADLRRISAAAKSRISNSGKRTLLFIDEIHRFNRAQQDVLLVDVENGVLILIGATTQNPFFSIVSPLLSRSSIFQFKALSCEDVKNILVRAVKDTDRGLGEYDVDIDDEAVDFLATTCDGDARRALTALEVGVLSSSPGKDGRVHFTAELAADSMQRKMLVYDGTGDEHYDIASAFIKSMRGSDPDAALYWMARMLESGEDARFIARRLVICASEDVGNANPNAIVLATSAMQACEFVGMPEARIILAQAVTYVACSPKSNASYCAISEAIEDVRNGRTMEVPDHLKDSSYGGAKRLKHGEGYKYSHDYEGGYVAQDYLPAPRIYYQPTENGAEAKIKERLDKWRKARQDNSSRGK